MGEINSYFYADGKVNVLIENLNGMMQERGKDCRQILSSR